MFLQYVSTLSCLAPFFVSILFWKQIYSANKWLIIHLAVCALVEVSCFALTIQFIPNITIYSFYTPVEFFLLAKAIGATNKTVNLDSFVLPATLFIALLSVLEFLQLNGSKAMASLSIATEYLLLTTFALHTFYRIMLEQTEVSLLSSPRFWLAAGVLLYTCGSLFSFLARFYFSTRGTSFPHEFWIIHSLLNISFQLILIQTIVCYRKATQFG